MLCVFNFIEWKSGASDQRTKTLLRFHQKKIFRENYMNFSAYRVLLDGNWSKTNNSTIKHFNHTLFNIIQNMQKPHTLLPNYTLLIPHQDRSFLHALRKFKSHFIMVRRNESHIPFVFLIYNSI